MQWGEPQLSLGSWHIPPSYSKENRMNLKAREAESCFCSFCALFQVKCRGASHQHLKEETIPACERREVRIPFTFALGKKKCKRKKMLSEQQCCNEPRSPVVGQRTATLGWAALCSQAAACTGRAARSSWLWEWAWAWAWPFRSSVCWAACGFISDLPSTEVFHCQASQGSPNVLNAFKNLLIRCGAQAWIECIWKCSIRPCTNRGLCLHEYAGRKGSPNKMFVAYSSNG